MRQVILDTETTGLHCTQGHRIIEIGCIELVDRKFTGNRYHQFINPEREVDEGAVAIHGITSHFLKDKPKFSDIIAEFLTFVTGAELVIHNAPFDVGFINHEMRLHNKKSKPITDSCRILDTLVLAKQLHVGQRNNLDALCKRYAIDNSHREFHGALLDAHLLAQVYLSMTGGQGCLFAELLEEDEINQHDLNVLASQGIQPRMLAVLKATPEEISSHEQQLVEMAKKGSCLWLEETT